MVWKFKLLNLIINIFSVIICLSIKSLFMIWFLMEVNFLTFIALLNFNFCKFQSMVSMKYFCVQSSMSVFILLSIILSKMSFNTLYFLFIIILLKLGAAPFHSWFISVSAKISWTNFFLLCTSQKMILLYMVSILMNSYILKILLVSMVSVLFTALKQTTFKKILSYSSVFSMNWVLSSMMLNFFWMKFFLFYSAIQFLVILNNYFTHSHFNKNINGQEEKYLYIFFIMSILTLMGMPPFPIFFLKLYMINILSNFSIILCFLLLINSSMFIFIYSSFMFKYLTKSPSKYYFNIPNYFNFLLALLNFFAISLTWVFFTM